MGALQDLASCQLMPHPAFAVKNGKRRKITPLGQWVDQETATAEGNEDQELIERAMAGDSAAQSRLFATHTPRLYRVAFNVLRNREDAEDAVQDGWCSAYSKLHTFEGRSSLSTWLTRIVINSALTIRRRNKQQFRTSLDEVSDDARGLQHCLVDERRTPEEACGDREMNELLVRQIQQLPSPTRTAFLLRDVDELSTSESMERLGVNKGALKSRVLRARRRIAQNMRQLLHADRQRNRSFITEDCSVANRSSSAISSRGEASNDWV
jgi:RNA polymerase sigma-70 factor (ECF subfamily)